MVIFIKSVLNYTRELKFLKMNLDIIVQLLTTFIIVGMGPILYYQNVIIIIIIIIMIIIIIIIIIIILIIIKRNILILICLMIYISEY